MSTSLLTSGIILLFCITIYAISTSNKKKKENKFLTHISRLSGINIGKITKYDIWDQSIIGMDESVPELYFIGNSSDDQTFQKVILADIQRCWLNETSRTVSIKGSSVKVVEKVELILGNKQKSKPDTVIEFYNQQSGKLDLTGELQLAQKWNQLINDKMSSISK